MNEAIRESFDIRRRQSGAMLKSRLTIVSMGFCLAFLILAAKAVEVTLLNDKWKDSSSYRGIKPLPRTEIVDRNGIILATNLKTKSAYANPREMIDPKEAAEKISRVLPHLSYNELYKSFTRDASFVWVKRNLTPDEIKLINHQGVPGVYFTEDIARVYPHGPLLAHVLGYVNVDNLGLAGIERELDELLEMGTKEPVQLSIDIKIQHALRDEMEKQFLDYKAAGAAGMVVNVKTGEIVAMVSLPDFDPNSPGTAEPEQKFNRVTLGAYEMGSTFKAFTAAAALDSGTIKMNSMFDATTPIKVGRQTISDYHAKKRVLSLTEVMMYSSNIGTAKMAIQLGGDKFSAFLKNIGMFDYAEIEIPEKAKPLSPKRWPDITTMTVSFGHGIAVTPVHMAKGMVALVNGGYLVPLTLTKRKPNDIIESKQVISQKTSAEIRQILRTIVTEGTGRGANAEGYLVGGKTGTAEKLVGGRYSKDRVLSSFIATFPINDPEYFVITLFDDPKEKQRYVRPTGGVIAAPPIKNIIMRMGAILRMKPQYEENPKPKDLYVTNEMQKVI